MDKKQIIDLINKTAQIPQLHKSKAPAAQPTEKPSSNSASSLFDDAKSKVQTGIRTTTQSVSQFVKRLAPVKDMQTAIQDLAATVMQDSTKALNDFLSEQYIAQLDPAKKGTELKTDVKLDSKPQTDPYDLDVVMSSLKQIYTSHIKVNGVWDYITNNLLSNIKGLAYGLLQLEGDFKLKNNSYTMKNWEEFNKLISDYQVKGEKIELSIEEKSKRALQIINHLKGIKNLYNSFRYQIQARPEYRSLIEGKKALDIYTSTNISKLEQELLDNPYTSIQVSIENATYNIPLVVLESKESFLNFMKQYKITDEKTALKYLNMFKNKINSM